MRSKDRLIVAMAVVTAAASLTGAAALMPGINRNRAELQLTANDQVMKNLPPDIALAHAALGSARGLIVDFLWTRATKLKEEGKFYEAMQLADWITKLQPRFPQVWAFNGWNMAYNISVATHTPQERWMWVQAGYRLLRDSGIPLNPSSVQLYKELAWIYLHKIGKFSDDMHWYYKQQFALEWHRVLGEPPHTEPEAVVAWFAPVAEAYEKYVNDREPDRRTRAALEALIASSPSMERLLMELRPLSLHQMEARLGGIERRSDEEVVKQLQPLRRELDRQLAAALVDPRQRLLNDKPELRAQLDALAAMGFRELNREFLAMLSILEGRQTSVDVKLLGLVPRQAPSEQEKALRAWMDDASIQAEREAIIAFARAKVLQDEYHMNPLWMLELMEGRWFGVLADVKLPPGATELVGVPREGAILPLDWRHPAAHGLYWTSLGVRKSKGLLRPDDFDILNTDRQIMMAIQDLTMTGRLIFDPVSGYYRQTPEPWYLPGYELAVFGSQERLSNKQRTETDAPESFRAAHENFLISAVQMAYFFGNERMAQTYYEKARRLYSGRGDNRLVRYARPLRDFVQGELDRDESWTSMDEMLFAVTGLLTQAIETGLAGGQSDAADRYISAARRIYENYQVNRQPNRQNKGRLADRGRMQLPPFDEMLADVVTRYLTQPPTPGTPMLAKVRVWAALPLPLKQRVYDAVAEPLAQQSSRTGINAEIAFAPPAGMAEYRRLNPPVKPDGPQPPAVAPPTGLTPLQGQEVVR